MSSGFSAFEGEDEVLIQDGLDYEVMNNEQKMCDKGTKYYQITLRHPPLKQRKDTNGSKGSSQGPSLNESSTEADTSISYKDASDKVWILVINKD